MGARSAVNVEEAQPEMKKQGSWQEGLLPFWRPGRKPDNLSMSRGGFAGEGGGKVEKEGG